MIKLRDVCCRNHIDFICEFIPGLDEFDPSTFEKGIFRYGLPAVYQMIPLFGALSEGMNWVCFCHKLKERFKGLDNEYLELLKGFWDDGQLFDNTNIGSKMVKKERLYYRTQQMNSARGTILSWD